MKKTIFATLLLIASLKAFCGVVDHDLMYQAYLNNKMNVWKTELKKYTTSPNLTITDKLEISNYLYGYIATLLVDADKNKKEIISWIDLWEKYLNDIEKAKGKNAYVYVYRSSINAYKSKVKAGGMMVWGPQSLTELKRALETDPNNPLANGLKGNMLFYMPGFVGGDKEEAIKWFEKALTRISTNTDKTFRWNRCAITLCLAQAYEKTGNKKKAIEICTAFLQREPNYTYMRDTYLPSLTQ
jgi:tetratricopeptide (TPR) repeat protein